MKVRVTAVVLAGSALLLVGCGTEQQPPAPVTLTTSVPTTIVSRSTVTVISTVTYDAAAAALSSSAASASSVAAAGGAEFQGQLAAAGLTSPDYDTAVRSCGYMDAGKDPFRGAGGINMDLYSTLLVSREDEWKGLGITIATLCPQHQPAYDAAVQKRADNRATAERQSQITYSVTSSGSDYALITYAEDSNFNLAQENGAALPWSKDVTIPEGSLRILSLSAQNSGGGDISCSIAVGGQVVDTATSSGDYAIVTCSHNG